MSTAARGTERIEAENADARQRAEALLGVLTCGERLAKQQIPKT